MPRPPRRAGSRPADQGTVTTAEPAGMPLAVPASAPITVPAAPVPGRKTPNAPALWPAPAAPEGATKAPTVQVSRLRSHCETIHPVTAAPTTTPPPRPAPVTTAGAFATQARPPAETGR